MPSQPIGSLTHAPPSGQVVLDSSLPGLVFSQQFIQLPVGEIEEGTYFTQGQTPQTPQTPQWETFETMGQKQILIEKVGIAL